MYLRALAHRGHGPGEPPTCTRWPPETAGTTGADPRAGDPRTRDSGGNEVMDSDAPAGRETGLPRRLLAIGGVAAALVIGTVSAFAQDSGGVAQQNGNSASSVVTSGGSSTGVVSIPIVAPVTTGAGANANA